MAKIPLPRPRPPELDEPSQIIPPGKIGEEFKDYINKPQPLRARSSRRKSKRYDPAMRKGLNEPLPESIAEPTSEEMEYKAGGKVPGAKGKKNLGRSPMKGK